MQETYKGKAFVVGNDIDTDQIYHGQYLPLTDPQEMAKHAMEYVPGMENFLKEVKPGDILIAGRNFGCGSSREHAPLSLKYAGIAVVAAESFAGIYYRNSVNIGLPLIETAHLNDMIANGDEVEINIKTGQLKNLSRNLEIKGRPVPELEMEIMEKGGLLPYLLERGL